MNRYHKLGMSLAVALILTVLGASISPIQADPLPTASAQQLVEETSERMLQTLRNKREELEEHPERIYDLVKEILLPHFDFQRIARLALGRHWRQANEEQRQRFVGEFRTLLVRTYSTALLKYSDEKINYLPLRGPKEAENILVRMEIEQARGGPPISMEVDLYEKGENWKVYDVKIDGVSLVTNYRTNFASEIRQGGLDQLIEKLEKKNQKAGA
ncbi:MlaC/ttg2D family ABC transporter substrate-binding protein [Nitrosococcus wardiae]|uniref:ABC transporter substrate-binding protein n=1 Tax=Nitrosococcus wardiae TaxID=1814290 RepID=A0A4V1AVS3_9GAMM|nr:ABC transporter substrate-binding protein [Nitrosococcus wardiae]QBQ54135.1 ABC transporter substrate-binding protein [Nitrosococcus wardiae]